MGFFGKLFGTGNVEKKEKKPELPEELVKIMEIMAARQKAFDDQRKAFREETPTNVKGDSSPDYGLCKENPIFVNGMMSNDRYIGSLVTENNTPLNWNRVGTDRSNNVPGITDIYEGSLADGSVYCKIFVNVYGISEPMKAPIGLKINKNNRVKVNH